MAGKPQSAGVSCEPIGRTWQILLAGHGSGSFWITV